MRKHSLVLKRVYLVPDTIYERGRDFDLRDSEFAYNRDFQSKPTGTCFYTRLYRAPEYPGTRGQNTRRYEVLLTRICDGYLAIVASTRVLGKRDTPLSGNVSTVLYL